jgi:hypothetical protein
LRDLPEADVTPMRSDWIEATVQKAVEAAAPVVPAQRTWWRRLQGVAAAAAALIGFQSIAAASFTVGAVVVTGVVVVSKWWPEGVNSDETLSFGRAIEILRSDEISQGSMSAVVRIGGFIGTVLDTTRESAQSASSELAVVADALLRHLRAEMSTPNPNRPSTAFVDDFDERVAGARAGSVSDLTQLTNRAVHGIRALHASPHPAVSGFAQQMLSNLRVKAGG